MTGTAPATQAVLLHPDSPTRPAPRTGVTRIGVTGHRAIPAAVEPVVRAGMRALFHGDGLFHDDGGDGLSHGDGDRGPLEALTSLAAGADQIFADIALANGVPVTAVIPGTDYEVEAWATPPPCAPTGASCVPAPSRSGCRPSRRARRRTSRQAGGSSTTPTTWSPSGTA